MSRSERLSYMLYRCVSCRRLLTKYQIIDKWEAAERTGESLKGLCVCGSGKISPANATLWEELTRPSIWRVWWNDIVLPKFGR